jgi:hypothetical protein
MRDAFQTACDAGRRQRVAHEQLQTRFGMTDRALKAAFRIEVRFHPETAPFYEEFAREARGGRT